MQFDLDQSGRMTDNPDEPYTGSSVGGSAAGNKVSQPFRRRPPSLQEQERRRDWAKEWSMVGRLAGRQVREER